jgi:hypothetical protein
MSITQIDLKRQSQDGTFNKEKFEVDLLNGGDFNVTNGNENATFTGLRDGTAASQDAATVKQMENAIASAIAGGMHYKGQLDASVATGETLDGGKTGDFWYISVAGTLDGKSFSIGDHLVLNADVTDWSVDGAGKADKVDNTESDDILRDADIVDDLTTGGTTSVLSAEQGKVLKGITDDLQTEVDAIETGAGLNTDGTYTADGGSNYISGATSLKNADSLLDAQIKTNTDAIAAIPTDVFSEAPTVTDGSPTVTLANTPDAGTERVYLNGIRQQVGAGNDYTISGAVITFADNLKAPNKDVVIVDYRY